MGVLYIQNNITPGIYLLKIDPRSYIRIYERPAVSFNVTASNNFSQQYLYFLLASDGIKV